VYLTDQFGSWVFVPIVSVGSIGQMVDLARNEDGSDYMLVEWAAALELHQRGRVKAVLPLLVGQTDFWSEAHAAFGGVHALPNQVSAATMEKVVMHLGQTTGDDSMSKLRELLQQASGELDPTVQGLVACILKFQGVKLSQTGAATAHSHGHLSAGIDDLHECTSRIQGTVSSCLKQVGSTQ
jgi:hypothetical protein